MRPSPSSHAAADLSFDVNNSNKSVSKCYDSRAGGQRHQASASASAAALDGAHTAALDHARFDTREESLVRGAEEEWREGDDADADGKGLHSELMHWLLPPSDANSSILIAPQHNLTPESHRQRPSFSPKHLSRRG